MARKTEWAWTKASTKAAALVADDTLSDFQIAKRVGVVRATISRWKDEPAFAAEVAILRTALLETTKTIGIADVRNRLHRLDASHAALRTILRERGGFYEQERERLLEEIKRAQADLAALPVPSASRIEELEAELAKYKAGDWHIPDIRKDLDPLYKQQRRIDALTHRIESMRCDPAFHPAMETGHICHRVVPLGKGGGVADVYETDTGTLGELRAMEAQAAKELGQWTEKTETSVTVTDATLSDTERADRLAAIYERARQERARQAASDGAAQPA